MNEAPLWERVADALYFIDNTQALADIADRFESEYATAYANATSDAGRDRALSALLAYLSSGATPRKHWSLSHDDAQHAAQALATLL
jgi:hypothetical protein